MNDPLSDILLKKSLRILPIRRPVTENKTNLTTSITFNFTKV